MKSHYLNARDLNWLYLVHGWLPVWKKQDLPVKQEIFHFLMLIFNPKEECLLDAVSSLSEKQVKAKTSKTYWK